MTSSVSRPPQDPLGRDIVLSHARELPVLGLRVRFETNDPAVLSAVEDSFGLLQNVWDPLEFDAPAKARVRVFVQENDPDDRQGRIRFRSPDPNRLLVTGPASFGVAEIERRESYAYVSASLLSDVQLFQYGVLEPLTLMLVTGTNRQPMHAAVVADGGAALLLVGRSGSGKSSLAYAASRSGIRVLSEDTAYVQSEPSLCMWTIPRRVHLLPQAVRFFPELKEQKPSLLPNGKSKLVVELDQTGAQEMLPVAGLGVCLLEKSRGAPRIQETGPAEVERALTAELESGFDFFRDGALAAGRQLATGALRRWQLHMSADPRESVPLLRQMLADLVQIASTSRQR